MAFLLFYRNLVGPCLCITGSLTDPLSIHPTTSKRKWRLGEIMLREKAPLPVPHCPPQVPRKLPLKVRIAKVRSHRKAVCAVVGFMVLWTDFRPGTGQTRVDMLMCRVAGETTVRTESPSSKGQNKYNCPTVITHPLTASARLTARQTGHGIFVEHENRIFSPLLTFDRQRTVTRDKKTYQFLVLHWLMNQINNCSI